MEVLRAKGDGRILEYVLEQGKGYEGGAEDRLHAGWGVFFQQPPNVGSEGHRLLNSGVHLPVADS